ncbi:MAG: hypothetical protein ACYS5V_13840, partial [Planctomycetota bacterium]
PAFLNSPGVSYKFFSGEGEKGANRYKLFTNPKLRKVVLSRMVKQLQKDRLVLPSPEVTLCLAAGHLRKGNGEAVKAHCEKNGWKLFAEDWFREQFDRLAESRYENDIAIVAAKLANLAAKT